MFHFNALKEIFPGMVDITKGFMDELADANTWQSAKETFSRHTFRIINYLAFGKHFNSTIMMRRFHQLNHRFNVFVFGKLFFREIWEYFPIPWALGVRREQGRVRQSIVEVIRKERNKPVEGHDLLSLLVHAVDAHGNPIREDLIIDECFTFLFAGHDTTSTVLSWITYFMSLNPDVQKKVHQEVKQILGDRDPEFEDLENLKYCKKVLKETLRSRPIIPFIERTNTEEMVVHGKNIPKDSILSIGLYALHHDSRYWDNPYNFDPDRWDNPKCKEPFVFIPFSAGQRNCIGSKFANQEILLTMAIIFRQYTVMHDTTKNVVPGFEGVVGPLNLMLKFSPIESQ